MLIDRYMESLRESNLPASANDMGQKVHIDGRTKKEKALAFAKKHKKAALIAGGAAAAGAAGVAAAKALKAKRAKKAQEVAVEEGISLEEAFEYVLEAEQLCLNEGYDFDEIYTEGKKGAIIGAALNSTIGTVSAAAKSAKRDPLWAAQMKALSPKQKRAVLGTAAAINAGTGAIAGHLGEKLGQKVVDKVKAKRAKKAQEVAVEEGVSLDEAFDYVLECEQMLLDEGYDFEEIYDEANIIKKTGRAAAGAIRGSYDGAAEGMKKGSDYGDDLVGGGIGKAIGGNLGYQVGGVVGAVKGVKKGWKGEYVKERRARKAKEVAREEGVSLEEAFEYVLECEQEYLNEGYSLEEIYDEANLPATANDMGQKVHIDGRTKKEKALAFAKKHKKAALIAGGAAAAGAAGVAAAKALKAKRAKKAQEVAVEEGVSLEEAFEYVLEMEQAYLNEGYDFTDLYDFED